jgi:hypothetical protein
VLQVPAHIYFLQLSGLGCLSNMRVLDFVLLRE